MVYAVVVVVVVQGALESYESHVMAVKDKDQERAATASKRIHDLSNNGHHASIHLVLIL